MLQDEEPSSVSPSAISANLSPSIETVSSATTMLTAQTTVATKPVGMGNKLQKEASGWTGGRHCSNEVLNDDEEDTSSSDLKWDTFSITSGQSGTGITRFDTLEDVSHAVGKQIIIYIVLCCCVVCCAVLCVVM